MKMAASKESFENYYDYEDTIEFFFQCSIKNDFSTFDFKRAFDSLRTPIRDKLTEHGQTTFSEFKELEEQYYGVDEEKVKDFTTDTSYITISASGILDCICRYRFHRFRETFQDYDFVEKLKNIDTKIDNIDLNNKQECVLLFDEIIHAYHENGRIFEDIDIEALKAKVDSDYERSHSR